MRIEHEDGSVFDIAIGETVQLQPPQGELPYLARIQDMYSVDEKDEKYITGVWFYRKPEIHNHNKALIPWDARDADHNANEVYMSSLLPETNPIASIISSVQVHHLMDGAALPTNMDPRAHFCRYKYKNGGKGATANPFRPLRHEDLPRQLLQTYRGKPRKPENEGCDIVCLFGVS